MNIKKLSWTARYCAISVTLILGFVGAFHHRLGLDDLFAEGQVGLATILGLVGMIAVGVALMAALFYSSRSGMDDAAHDARDSRDKSEEPREPPKS